MSLGYVIRYPPMISWYMADDETEQHKVLHFVREAVIYTVYGVAAYRILDNLCNGAISLYMANYWYRVKARYTEEMQIKQQTGKVIFAAMEVVENEG